MGTLLLSIVIYRHHYELEYQNEVMMFITFKTTCNKQTLSKNAKVCFRQLKHLPLLHNIYNLPNIATVTVNTDVT